MASDSGGQQCINASSVKPTQVQSYASAMRPKREQAIIIEANDNLTNDDYIDGLETITAVSNIVSISKISGGRICVFLNNKALVEKISGSTIRIKSYELQVRPLIESNKRLVLSNIQTHIPNEILSEALISHGIIPATPIQNIRASLSKPGRSHIQSHRRQVYIKETNTPIPDSFKITYEDTVYWIYITDSTLCFSCKQAGHIAKLCPQNSSYLNTQHTELPAQSSQTISDSQLNILHTLPLSPTSTPTLPDNQIPITPSPPAKRHNTGSLTTSSTSSTLTEETTTNREAKIKKPTAKKMKKSTIKVSSLHDIRTQMEPLEKFIKGKQDTYPLNYEKITEFLFSTYNKSNVQEIAKIFTKNTSALISMLSDIEDLTTNINIQNRIKRLIIRLTNPLNSSLSNDEESSSAVESDFQQQNNDGQE